MVCAAAFRALENDTRACPLTLRCYCHVSLFSRYFDAFINFIASTRSLVLKWSTHTPAGALAHVNKGTKAEHDRDNETGDNSFRTINHNSIDKKAIRMGGYFTYEGPFVVNKFLKEGTKITNLAAQAVQKAKPRKECLAQVDTTYKTAMTAATTAKARADKRCDAMASL